MGHEGTTQRGDQERGLGIELCVGHAEFDRGEVLGETDVPHDHSQVERAADPDESGGAPVVVRGVDEGRRGSGCGPPTQENGAPTVVAGVVAAPERRVGRDRREEREPRAHRVQRDHTMLSTRDADVHVEAADLVVRDDTTHVVDDVVISAFGSAGQRCSALRVVYVQDDIADRFCKILKGAIAELRLGDAREFTTDIGPVIDAEALRNLEAHKEYLNSFAKKIGEAAKPSHLNGYYFAPLAYEIDSLSKLKGEVFGPILHVIRYKLKNRDKIIEEINATGYGLTFGLHSRLEKGFAKTADHIHAGNIYINRSIIGAVVGVQPFGGMGLSGTGPKAGGPYYLPRFAHEKTITINTTATGGNLELISLEDK